MAVSKKRRITALALLRAADALSKPEAITSGFDSLDLAVRSHCNEMVRLIKKASTKALGRVVPVKVAKSAGEEYVGGVGGTPEYPVKWEVRIEPQYGTKLIRAKIVYSFWKNGSLVRNGSEIYPSDWTTSKIAKETSSLLERTLQMVLEEK